MSGSPAALTGVADAVKDHGPERKAVETGRRWHDFLTSILLLTTKIQAYVTLDNYLSGNSYHSWDFWLFWDRSRRCLHRQNFILHFYRTVPVVIY